MNPPPNGWVADRTAGMALPIEHAEHAVRLALDHRAAMDRLRETQRDKLDGDPDVVYAEVDRLLARQAALDSQLNELDTRLRRADERTRLALSELYVYYNGEELAARIDHTHGLAAKARDEIRAARIAAYGAEPGRVRFVGTEPEAQTAAAVEAGRPPQGSLLVVVWGEEPGEVTVWNETYEPVPPPEGSEVFFASARGILHAFDPLGRLLWARRLGVDSHRLPQRVPATATSPAARIAVSAEDNTLIALAEATGEVLWQYRVGQDIVAGLTIIERPAEPDAAGGQCGLLPTADGEIHVLELVLGKPLGTYEVGRPITVGGGYDPKTGLVFFPADAKRIFAIDPAAIEDPDRPACRSILFTNHSSGAIRSEPVVVGQYLIVSEASELEHTRLRAFEIGRDGRLGPVDLPRKEVSLRGWAWFHPHCTPDRITLVTDHGDVGLFGLNLDNRDEALYRIVPDWNTGRADPFRALTVHAEEHLLWIMSGGRLDLLSIDVVHQRVRSLWADREDRPGLGGIPVHRAQADRFAGRFFLTTMSPTGREYRFAAVESSSGDPLWHRQLGLNLLGDPLPWKDGAVLIDRSGRWITILPSGPPAGGGAPLPPGADDRDLMRLDDGSGVSHVAVPCDGGTRLEILRVDPASSQPPSGWHDVFLKHPISGRPCISGEHVAVPCADGQIYRVPLESEEEHDTTAYVSFSTRSRSRVDLHTLPAEPGTAEAILVVDGRRHVRRLELRTEEGVTQWVPVGREFHPDDNGAELVGQPLEMDGRLFTFDSRGTLYCLDANDPAHRLAEWPLELKITRGPVLRGDRLVAVADGRRLVCLATDASADSPQPVWITEPFGGRIRGMPVLAGDTLLVADNSRRITGVRLADGKPAWSTRLRVRVGPSAAPVPCAENKMLVPLSDGSLQVMLIPPPETTEPKS